MCACPRRIDKPDFANMQSLKELAFPAAVCVYLYGCSRILSNPLKIHLQDTKDHILGYRLDSGLFWDYAEIRKLRRSDLSLVSSEQHYSALRSIAIEHEEFKD